MSGQASIALSAVLAGAVLLSVVARTPATSKTDQQSQATEQIAPPRAPVAANLRLPTPPPLPAVDPAPEAPARAMPMESTSPKIGSVSKVAVAAPRRGPAPVVASSPRGEGRTLLRLLEHGQGPVIEFAWPEDRSGREELYRRLSHCHGMRTAVARADGGLFTIDPPPGQPWAPDLDRFSGYMRATAGAMPAAEQVVAGRIRARHGLSADAATVRLFPRRMDGELLAGLRALIGPGYRDARSIHGRYVLSDEGVLVRDLSVDGRAVAGLIALGSAEDCSR